MSLSGNIRSRLVTVGVLIFISLCLVVSLGWHRNSNRIRQFVALEPGNQRKSLIPPNIFQIFYGHTGLTEELQKDTDSWLVLNPTHTYHRLGQDGAIEFLHTHFSERQDLVDLYSSLRSPALAADLLRYLVLAAQGGVYSDVDTKILKPIDLWVPHHLVGNVSAIVGIEYDRGQKERLPGFSFDVQFCQCELYTIGACYAPCHSLLS